MADGQPQIKPRLRPVQRQNLTDLAYEAIRRSVATGAFAMGEHLREVQLASDLGMGRTPVREALQRLVKEGLLVNRPHQGMLVAQLDAGDLIDLYNVRLALEQTAARLFVRHGGDVEPLRAAIRLMERAATRGDMAGVIEAEFDFHRHLARDSGNALLLSFFGHLEGRLMMAIGLDDRAIDIDTLAQDHLDLLEALESGDEEQAAEALERHLSTSRSVIEQLGGDARPLLGRQ